MREGDFLETKEGLIFDVKGMCHPPDRVIAYVRYVPSPDGDRKRGGVLYRKIYDLEERSRFLKEKYPHYLHYDPVFHREMQGVPHQHIQRVFRPSEKLHALICAEKRDDVEEGTVQLAEEIGIPEAMGVSGSLLVAVHTSNSDIDLLVYGEEPAFKAYENLKVLREKGAVNPLDLERAKERAQFRWGFADEKVAFSEQKKILHGLFRGREYFVRLLRWGSERYGEKEYIPLGKVEVRAVVKDDTYSIFTPCCYRVGESSLEDLETVMSLRGRFCEQAKCGDAVKVRGTLERVLTKEKDFYQIMLGESGDYLALIESMSNSLSL